MKRIGQATPLCSWLDSKGWTGGAKVQLKINVVEVKVFWTFFIEKTPFVFFFKYLNLYSQETSSWNISFDFNKDVTFEAWKGDINALTGFVK